MRDHGVRSNGFLILSAAVVLASGVTAQLAATADAPTAPAAAPAAAAPAAKAAPASQMTEEQASAQALALATQRLSLTTEQAATVKPLLDAYVTRLRKLFAGYTGGVAPVTPAAPSGRADALPATPSWGT